jgi:hypothetical protein
MRLVWWRWMVGRGHGFGYNGLNISHGHFVHDTARLIFKLDRTSVGLYRVARMLIGGGRMRRCRVITGGRRMRRHMVILE